MQRISRPAMFMEMAEVVAKRGTCIRGCTGAIITRDDRPISMGYNGPPAGEAHCHGSDCPGRKDGCVRAIHAEINAMNYAKEDLSYCTMYVTSWPCLLCAKAISVRGLQKLFFRNSYRVTEGLDILYSSPIEVYHILPSGMILDESGNEVYVD